MTGGRAVLRADASAAIGTGHVVRCRTLGSALVARGWTVTFASRDLPEALVASVREAGMGIVPIPSDLGSEAEADALDAVMPAEGVELVVADHYGIQAAWFERLRDKARVLMAIDDLGDRPQPVDLLLDQNLGTEAGRYDRLAPGARVLVGPRFALVRPEFAALRARRGLDHTRLDGSIARVLVFVSGADIDDVTARAVDALTGLELAVDVVVGASYGHSIELRRRVERLHDGELHVNVDTMAELTDAADLAIGAPSSASWERCTLGLPTLMVVLADNQLGVERALVEAGAAMSLGWHTMVTARAIRDMVVVLQNEPGRVAAMARAAAGITDGRGTERVVAEIEALVADKAEAR